MSASDFLREAEGLRRLLCKEERESRRTDLRHTFSDCTELNNQLRADMMKVQQQLQKLKNAVFRFQQQLMDAKPSPDVIDRLKDTMMDIENSISMFKDTQHQSFEELLKDERIFWQEICAFEKKIEAWSLPVKADVRLPGARSDRLRDDGRNLPAEVTELETFLQRTGGPRGGWDEYDHQSFLKVWTKHSGKPSYRQEVRLYLPGKTEEELKLHEEWFLELRRRQEKKREAVHRWREAKQRERELQREQQDADDARTEPQDEEQRRLKQEERRREAAERLEAWRSRREQEREQEQEQRLRNEILQRRRAKEEQRRQLEVKLMVEARVRQKKEEEELRLLEEEEQQRAEREERQRQAAEAIKRFQERDSLRLEEKLQEKQSKEEERWERQRTLEKLKEKVHVSRDPSRLWKRTKVWEERMREIGPSGSGAAPLLHVFHRAVPAWRQDL
ncbi:coiled-coil domain-containing protein 112 isoform X2 [Chanodichthys erythropterus]